MRIVRLGSFDSRFRTVNFIPDSGLNLFVADKTRASGVGDSRNGTGKTALSLIIRYLLGGNKPSKLAAKELSDHEFFAVFEIPGSSGKYEHITVRRSFKSTKVTVEGWSLAPVEPMNADEWTGLLARHVFGLSEELKRPTVGQLIGQFIRTDFRPTKTYTAETDWEAGCRYAFLLGLDPSVAAGAGEVARLTNQQKALNQAAKDGALADLNLDVATLRGRLVTARREKEGSADELQNFRVEERYQEHQKRANILSTEIRRLNERALILERQISDLARATDEVTSPETNERLLQAAHNVYEEAGISFSEVSRRRFEDVEAFHLSVVRNRILFLQQELATARDELSSVQYHRRNLDEERSQIMLLLQGSVALGTFMQAQTSITNLQAEISGIEDRLKIAERLENLGDMRDEKKVETKRRMRLELAEQETALDEARSLFSKIASEIYGYSDRKNRNASLDLGVSPKQGHFLVNPQISADGSAGISNVKTFVMDMVSICMAQKNGHSLGFLIHDSALFDPVDSEQVASCLAIGARLADEWGFQYIVSMNSDDLKLATADSGGTFHYEPYRLEVKLSDENDSQKLFGFGFD